MLLLSPLILPPPSDTSANRKCSFFFSGASYPDLSSYPATSYTKQDSSSAFYDPYTALFESVLYGTIYKVKIMSFYIETPTEQPLQVIHKWLVDPNRNLFFCVFTFNWFWWWFFFVHFEEDYFQRIHWDCNKYQFVSQVGSCIFVDS